MKLVLAQMKHETNTFSPVPTPLARFGHGRERPWEGREAYEEFKGTGTALGAFIDLAERAGAEVALPVAAQAWPSGRVAQDAYEFIAGRRSLSTRCSCTSTRPSGGGDLQGPVAAVYFSVMSSHIRQLVNDVVAALLFGLALALAMPQAYAGMISADDEERTRVKTMLERPQLATELERMGIPAGEASARVDAMTPGEVRELAGRLDAVAAGGQAGARDLLLVLLVVLLVLLLI